MLHDGILLSYEDHLLSENPMTTMQACKVLSSMWSKIGRLKRSSMPKLKGNTNYGSGATLGIMSCIAGRLLCDTDLCSRDLLKQV